MIQGVIEKKIDSNIDFVFCQSLRDTKVLYHLGPISRNVLLFSFFYWSEGLITSDVTDVAYATFAACKITKNLYFLI